MNLIVLLCCFFSNTRCPSSQYQMAVQRKPEPLFNTSILLFSTCKCKWLRIVEKGHFKHFILNTQKYLIFQYPNHAHCWKHGDTVHCKQTIRITDVLNFLIHPNAYYCKLWKNWTLLTLRVFYFPIALTFLRALQMATLICGR